MIFWYTGKPWEHTGIKGNPETMANFYLKLLYYNNSTISVLGFPWPGWKQSANWKNWVNVFITRWNTEKRVEKVMHKWGIFDELQDVLSGDQADVSSIWHSVSSGDETLCWMLDITSQTKWFYKEKLRMQKWAVFHLISKHSFNFNFPCIFFMNNY